MIVKTSLGGVFRVSSVFKDTTSTTTNMSLDPETEKDLVAISNKFWDTFGVTLIKDLHEDWIDQALQSGGLFFADLAKKHRLLTKEEIVIFLKDSGKVNLFSIDSKNQELLAKLRKNT